MKKMGYRRLLQRRDRLNAAVFIVLGNFALVMGTSIVLAFTGRFDYLLMLGLSAAAMIFTYSGVKPSIWGDIPLVRGGWMTPIFLTAGGSILAAEAAILFIFLSEVTPVLYTLTTLASTALMLLGSDILASTEVRNQLHPDLLREEGLVIERLTY